MDSNISIEKLKTYSHGRLEIIRNELPKELVKKEKLLEKIRESEAELETKLNEIRENHNKECVKKVIEKIGKKPSTILFGQDGPMGISVIIAIGLWWLSGVAELWLVFLIGIGFINLFLSYTIFYIPMKNSEKRVMEYEKEYESLLDKEKKKSKLNLILKPLEEKKLNYEKQKNKLMERIDLIESAKYKLPKLIMRAKDRERTAKAAAFDKQARIGSKTIRDDLLKSTNKRNWICPYCNKNKNLKTSEADHIHPVNKGGLSTVQNMVMICGTCNSKKKNLTLRTFCKKLNFDFNKICDTLENQGKDI